MSGTPAIFLDRDDTLIACRDLPPPPSPANPGDLCDVNLVRLLPGVAEACHRMRAAGFSLVVVSNQGVVARGAISTTTVDAINERVRQLIDADSPAGPCIRAFYYCPFHPIGRVPEFTREDEWRKPRPGMILAAAAELELDLDRSWLIGDTPRDVEAGVNAGIDPQRSLLIGEGAPFPNLAAAAEHILRRAFRA